MKKKWLFLVVMTVIVLFKGHFLFSTWRKNFEGLKNYQHKGPSLVQSVSSKTVRVTEASSKEVREPATTSRRKTSESKSPEFQNVIKAVDMYHQCRQSLNCSLEDTDSRAYDLALGADLRQKLQILNRRVAAMKLHGAELSELARALLNIPDGGVKAEALELMLSQPLQQEDLEVVGEAVFKDHDSHLLESGLRILARFLDQPEAPMVHAQIRECLLTGSLLVREVLAKNLKEFINHGSYQFYQKLSEDKRYDAPIRASLVSQLREWELEQSGG
jgi:hypothetical protein